jgi:copper chaperone CopZ
MKTVLRSGELTCPSCISKIERALRALDGVTGANVHFTTGRIEVEHDPERVSPARLAGTVTSLGYAATVSAF